MPLLPLTEAVAAPDPAAAAAAARWKTCTTCTAAMMWSAMAHRQKDAGYGGGRSRLDGTDPVSVKQYVDTHCISWLAVVSLYLYTFCHDFRGVGMGFFASDIMQSDCNPRDICWPISISLRGLLALHNRAVLQREREQPFVPRRYSLVTAL